MDREIATPSFPSALTFIVAVSAAASLPFLGAAPLWNIDEGRLAEISREMALTGDWIVPRIGGTVYGAYPPLANWLMALSGLALGFNEFSMRLPGALAGVGLIAVVGSLGRRLAGERAGLAAALVLATSSGFLSQMVICRADVLVTLLGAAAVERLVALAERPERIGCWMTLYVLLALGVLAKGPIVLVIFGTGAAAWIVEERRWDAARLLRPWWGIPFLVVLTVPWYAAACLREGPEFLRQNLMLENVEAFASGFEHPRPWWFYLHVAPRRLAPWVLLLPLAWPLRKEAGLRAGLAWFLAMAAVLTLSASKRPSYLVFAAPGLALATGIILDAACRRWPRRVTLTIAWGAVVSLAGALCAATLPIRWNESLRPVVPLLPLLLVAVAAGMAAVSRMFVRRGPHVAGATVLATVPLAMAAWFLLVEPRLDDEGRNGVAFCRRVVAAVPAGEPIRTVGPEMTEGAFYFHIRRSMPCGNGEPGWYLLTDAQRERLEAAGHSVKVLDALADRHGRLKVLARVGT